MTLQEQAGVQPRNEQAVLEPVGHSPLCWVFGGCSVSPVCRGLPGAKCSKGEFLVHASPVPPYRVSKEFLSAANDLKMNGHENILGTPTTSSM